MDHEELHNKIKENFKEKTRKEGLWERFASSRNLSDKVYKTWFESKMTL